MIGCLTPRKVQGLYSQCRLVKDIGSGTLEQTSWLPTKYAKVGKVVSLKESNGWSAKWRITLVNPWIRTEWRPMDANKDIKEETCNGS